MPVLDPGRFQCWYSMTGGGGFTRLPRKSSFQVFIPLGEGRGTLSDSTQKGRGTKSLIHSWVRGRGPKMEELEDQGERENLTHSFIDTYIYIYIDIVNMLLGQNHITN